MKFTLRYVNAFGLFASLSLVLLVPALSDFFQLSDRARYLSAGVSSSNLLDRTSFVETVFSFGLAEPLLVITNVLLVVTLCRRLVQLYVIRGLDKTALYLMAFAPFRLLFRSYASKELLFSIACELFLLVLLPKDRPELPSRAKSVPTLGSRILSSMLLAVLFAFTSLLRPFYSIILIVPFLQFYSFSAKVARNRNLVAALIVCIATALLFYLFFTPSVYSSVASLMTGYFLIDGANANSTRLDYVIPVSPLMFIQAFLAFGFQSVLGPTVSELVARPYLLFVYIEGIFISVFMALSLCNVISPARGSLRRPTISFTLLLLYAYMLFVYYLFSSINFMGGLRYQSASIPIVLYLYSMSCGIKNSLLCPEPHTLSNG